MAPKRTSTKSGNQSGAAVQRLADYISGSAVVEQIISRALVDTKFRDLLFNDRQAALASYELSADDCAAIELLEPKTFTDAEDVASIVGATCSARPATRR